MNYVFNGFQRTEFLCGTSGYYPYVQSDIITPIRL